MENTPLHAQKLSILSRLIKADQLTLEEALLLLKDEEKIDWQPLPTSPYAPFNKPYPSTTPYWTIQSTPSSGTFPLTGSCMTYSSTYASTLTSLLADKQIN